MVYGRHTYTGVISFFFLALFMVGCESGNTNAEASRLPSKNPLKVNTCDVLIEGSARVVTLSGFTEPIHRASPSARIMAKVVDASFQEGDRVESDRVLINLDTRDLLARKRQAEASCETASSALRIARRNLERMRNLQKSGTVSSSQLESTEVSCAQANAAAEGAKSGLDELEVNLSYAVARAPFSGVIVRKMVERGNMVTPGQPLFIIEDDSRLRLIAPLGADLATGIRPGQDLWSRIAGEKVKGTVEGIIPSGSTDAPGLRIQLVIDNGTHAFKPGTLALVEVPISTTDVRSISIPKETLIEKGRLYGAYVVGKDTTARLHWLILGDENGGYVSVLSGLKEGDRLILNPEGAGVRDGQPVVEIDK